MTAPHVKTKLAVHRDTLQVIAWINLNGSPPSLHFRLPAGRSNSVATKDMKLCFGNFLEQYWKPFQTVLINGEFKADEVTNFFNQVERQWIADSFDAEVAKTYTGHADADNWWWKLLEANSFCDDTLFPLQQMNLYITQPREEHRTPIDFTDRLMQAHVPLVLVWTTISQLRMENVPQQLAAKAGTLDPVDVLEQLRRQHPWLYRALEHKCLALAQFIFYQLDAGHANILHRADSKKTRFRFRNEPSTMELFECDLDPKASRAQLDSIKTLLLMKESFLQFYPPRWTAELIRQQDRRTQMDAMTALRYTYVNPTSADVFKKFIPWLAEIVEEAIKASLQSKCWRSCGTRERRDRYLQLPFTKNTNGEMEFYEHEVGSEHWKPRITDDEPAIQKQYTEKWNAYVRIIAALPLFDPVLSSTRSFESGALNETPFVEIRRIQSNDTDSNGVAQFTVTHPRLVGQPIYIVPVIGSVVVHVEDRSVGFGKQLVSVVSPGMLLQLHHSCLNEAGTSSTRKTYLTRPSLANQEDKDPSSESWVLIICKSTNSPQHLLQVRNDLEEFYTIPLM